MSRKTVLLATASAALAAGVAVIPVTAHADLASVGPNQYFVGVVNGSTDRAVIQVVCPGPLTPGLLGRPLPGQTVEVRQVSGIAAGAGFTGSSGRSIVAAFSPSSANDPSVEFTTYGAAEIPGTFTLPCSGSGQVSFSARPTSGSARSVTVRVTFVNRAE